MTIVEPLPVSGYGKADWVDYSNYWRETDSEWLMERSILRYQNPTLRTTQFPTPKFGQITYNEQAINLGGGNYADRAEMWSKQHNKWVPLLMLDNITSTKDDATGVGMSHKLAGGKGVVFEPARTVMDNPIYVMGGVLTVDATGITIKTGAKTVKLTTDAVGLVSDSPISATAFSSGGALTAVSATLSGSLTVANITLSGTLGGGVLNGSSGTIGGVALASNRATASDGFNVQGGSYYGDSSSAIMRATARTGSYVQVSQGNINFHGGGYTDVYNQMRVFGGQSIQYIRSDGVHTGYFAPTFWGDPGVGNVPEGSIMMQ